MNRKTFLVLMLILVVLGGASLALFWQDLRGWRGGTGRAGSSVYAKRSEEHTSELQSH